MHFLWPVGSKLIQRKGSSKHYVYYGASILLKILPTYLVQESKGLGVPGVVKNPILVDSLLWVNSQELFDEVLEIVRNVFPLRLRIEVELAFLNPVKELVFVLVEERRLSTAENEKDDS